MLKISKRKRNLKRNIFYVKKLQKIFIWKQNTLDPYLRFITSTKLLSSAARALLLDVLQKYHRALQRFMFKIYMDVFLLVCRYKMCVC